MKNSQFSSAPITILGERNVFFANATEAATDKLLCEDAGWLFYSFLDLSHKHLRSHVPCEEF